jgi:hypothetical protein
LGMGSIERASDWVRLGWYPLGMGRQKEKLLGKV